MADKDQLEALKKLNARARSASTGPHAALPTSEAPLHAGSAADLQGNVGNAGLQKMIKTEAGAHKPEHQKQAAHLEHEAARHKSTAVRERKVAQHKQPASPATAHPFVAEAHDGAHKAAHRDERTPKHAGKKRSQGEHSARPSTEQAEDQKAAPRTETRTTGAAKASSEHSHAAQKKASASEARAEASRSKAQVARMASVATTNPKLGAKVDDKSLIKSATNKDAHALQAETDAELAESHTLHKKKSVQAAAPAHTDRRPAHTDGSTQDEHSETAKTDAKKSGGNTRAEPTLGKKKNIEATVARSTVAARTQEADLAEQKVRKTEGEKQKAEAKAEAKAETKAGGSTGPSSNATAAKEAEVAARAHDAASALAVTKTEAKVKALDAEHAPALPTEDEISRAADLMHADGQHVTLIGTYVPRPAPGGSQMLGHVSILVGNIEVRLGTDTRGTAEMLRLSGERVAVTGMLDLKRASTEQATDPRKTEKPVLSRPGTVSRR